MKEKILILLLLVLATTAQAQTLYECQQAAEKNYPVIKRYDLIAKTTDLTVKNIRKGWLPQVQMSVQATYQSDVSGWPESMQGALQRMGLTMKGLKKDQYRAGIDLQQTLYDGGAISHQSKIAGQMGKVEAAQNDVNMYQVRKRVNEMYFSLLLLDEQIKLNNDVKELLLSSEQKLAAMLKGGTAATSDYENVKAERLGVTQTNESLKAQQQLLSQMLSVFCGIEVSQLHKPDVYEAASSVQKRPEMKLYDNQLQLANEQEKALNAQLIPHLGLFAQGYYGYPGLNLFEDMMHQKWSLNGIVGVKMSWNIGAFYTHKNDKAKLKLQREQIENARESFLFNTHLDEIQYKENIKRYRNMMQCDNEIIDLRTHIRKASESKLAHGIIDVNSLLREINNENAAKTQQAIHEIDMLKEMYNLKFTNNE